MNWRGWLRSWHQRYLQCHREVWVTAWQSPTRAHLVHFSARLWTRVNKLAASASLSTCSFWQVCQNCWNFFLIVSSGTSGSSLQFPLKPVVFLTVSPSIRSPAEQLSMCAKTDALASSFGVFHTPTRYWRTKTTHVTEHLVFFDSPRKFLLYPACGFYSLCYFSCSVFQGAHGKCASAF